MSAPCRGSLVAPQIAHRHDSACVAFRTLAAKGRAGMGDCPGACPSPPKPSERSGVAPGFQEEVISGPPTTKVSPCTAGSSSPNTLGAIPRAARGRRGRGTSRPATMRARDVGGREVLAEALRRRCPVRRRFRPVWARGEGCGPQSSPPAMIRLGTGSPAWVGLALRSARRVTSELSGNTVGNSNVTPLVTPA